MSQIDQATIPQAGEVWAHIHHGMVVVARRWNAKESVCTCIETGRRRVLMDCLMMARIVVSGDGVPMEAHTRDGRVVDLREAEGEISTPGA